MLTKKTVTFFCCCIISLFVSNAQRWDSHIVHTIQSQSTPSLDKTMLSVSNSAYFFVPAIPVGLFSTAIATKNNNMLAGSVQMSIGLASSALLSLGIKEIIQRDRPFSSHPDIRNIGKETGFSMPSAHTSFAFSLATSLTIQHPKWYVAVPSYLWAAGVAYSRMYLGVHYPSDIIVGILIGVGSAIIGYYVFPNKPENIFLFKK